MLNFKNTKILTTKAQKTLWYKNISGWPRWFQPVILFLACLHLLPGPDCHWQGKVSIFSTFCICVCICICSCIWICICFISNLISISICICVSICICIRICICICVSLHISSVWGESASFPDFSNNSTIKNFELSLLTGSSGSGKSLTTRSRPSKTSWIVTNLTTTCRKWSTRSTSSPTRPSQICQGVRPLATMV